MKNFEKRQVIKRRRQEARSGTTAAKALVNLALRSAEDSANINSAIVQDEKPCQYI